MRLTTRTLLGLLLLLVALNAFGGGYYGLSGAEGVPLAWLAGSPFRSYFLPSLLLFVCVGGSSLLASLAVFRRSRLARVAAWCSVAILFSWLITQVLIIGFVSWLQPATAAAGLLIALLTHFLPKH